jgi:hypothetical protein
MKPRKVYEKLVKTHDVLHGHNPTQPKYSDV